MSKSGLFHPARIPILRVFAALGLVSALVAGCASPPPAGTQIAGKPLPKAEPEMALQIGHRDGVESVVFSPDGQTLISGSRDRTVDLWDVRTGERRRTLPGSSGPVSAAAVSPDGREIAGGSEDQTVRVWDARTGTLLRTLRGQTGPVTAAAFSPDGKFLADGSEAAVPGKAFGRVEIWDRQHGTRRTLPTTLPVAAIAFSPDGAHLAVAADSRQQMPGQQWPVTVWDVRTGLLLSRLPQPNVTALQYLRDGTLVTNNGWSGVVFWDTTTGKRLRTLTLSLPVPAEWSSPAVTYLRVVNIGSLAVSPDGSKIAVGVGGTGDNAAAIFDALTGTRLQTLSGFRAAVAAVAFSPDGTTLATGTGDKQQDSNIGDVALWDAKSGKLRETMRGDENWVSSVAFAGNGRSFVTSSSDHTARVWDAETGALRRTVTDPAKIFVAALSPNGDTLATGNEDAAVHLWDMETGRVTAVIAAHAESVDSLAWSPDGQILASGGGHLWSGDVKLWEGRSGRLLRRMAGRSEGINAVAFSPDGRQVAAGSDDNTVKLWDSRTGRLERALDGYDGYVESVAFSPDGREIAAGKDSQPGGELKIWDARTGRLLHAWTALPYSVDDVEFSPDGKRLALACRLSDQRFAVDDTCIIQVWDSRTGKRRWTLPGPRYGAHSGAFAPDGRSLLTASRSDAVQLWNTRTGALRVTLRILQPGEPGRPSLDWIAFTPEGDYDASPGAEKFIRWRVGDSLFPASAYSAQFHRPAFVQQRLSGRE